MIIHNNQNDNIIIEDWAGNCLFKGDYRDSDVDKVLDANRCSACAKAPCDDGCPNCDDTGYWGDFEVFWEDEKRKDNVYEYINY